MAIGPDDIDEFFDGDDSVEAYLEAIADELARAYEIGALKQGITKSQAQLRAEEFARNHAAELIDGLEEVTRSTIKDLVADTISQGLSLGDLRDRIERSGLFSRSRADTIARTETAIAYGQGTRGAAQELGEDQKRWVRNQEEPEDECTDNEDADWIGIDETFPSGDDTIPAHPNCQCDVIYRTSSLHEDEDEEDTGDETNVDYVKLFAQALLDYSEDQERDDHGRWLVTPLETDPTFEEIEVQIEEPKALDLSAILARTLEYEVEIH